MKISIVSTTLLCLALVTGCGSETESAPSDSPAAGDENDLTKAKAFTCTGDSDAFDNIELRGTGNSMVLITKTDSGTFKAKYDPTYPNARTKPNNVDFRRFNWVDDPWQESGSSVMFVHKDILAGKAGKMKYQATGEVFINELNTCTPKK